MKIAGSYLTAALLLCLGLLMIYHAPFTTGFTQIPIDEGDSRFNHYLLEHSYRWLAGDPLHKDLWTPPIFYPAKNTIAYSDAMAGYGWWYWPLRAAGLSPNTAYVFWMVFSSAMNFGAMLFLLTRLFHVERTSASIGAFLFAFGIPRTVQLGHQQLLPQIYVLCIFTGLILLIKPHGTPGGKPSAKRTAGAWTLVIVGTVAQFYAGFYHLWFAVFGIAWLFICGLFFAETRAALLKLIRRPLPLLAASGLVVLCLWPLMKLYLGALSEAGPRQMDTVYQMLPRIQSWIFPGKANWMYGGWCEMIPAFNHFPYPGEHVLGVGPVTTVLILLGLASWRKTAWGRAALAAIACIMAVTLFYSPQWNPWALVAQWIPGASAIRAVTRVSLLLLIPASLALAMHIQSIKTGWIKTLLILLVVSEQGMSVSKFNAVTAQERIEGISAQVAKHDGPFYFVHQIDPEDADRYTGEEYVAQLDAMWAGLQVHRPTLNGYSGNAPKGWMLLYFNSIRREPDHARVQSYVQEWMKLKGADFDAIRIVDDRKTVP